MATSNMRTELDANALLNDTTVTVDVVMRREWLMKARLKVFAAIIRFGAWLTRINAEVTTEVVDDADEA